MVQMIGLTLRPHAWGIVRFDFWCVAQDLIVLSFKKHLTREKIPIHINYTFSWLTIDVGLKMPSLHHNRINLFSKICVSHLPRIGSDHYPILIQIMPNLGGKQRLFWFQRFWLAVMASMKLCQEPTSGPPINQRLSGWSDSFKPRREPFWIKTKSW